MPKIYILCQPPHIGEVVCYNSEKYAEEETMSIPEANQYTFSFDADGGSIIAAIT